jgi:CHAD domain-containing protein
MTAALARIDANLAGARDTGDPESLHRVRVGLRRLGSSLQAYRALLPRKKRKRLARRIREVLRPLGAARDWDVFADWLRTLGASALVARATSRRAAAQVDVRRALSSQACEDVLAAARGLARHPAARVAAEARFARAAMERVYRRAMKQARRMDWDDPEDRHALRVKLKRLRYSCEFLAPLFSGRAVAGWLRDLERLQDIFGELNDVRVGRELLEEIAPGERPLRRRLDARRAVLLRRLGPAWRSLQRRAPFWRPPE